MDRSYLDGCVRVHEVWKRELAVTRRSAGRPREERTAALVAEVYRPYAQFWSGYVGDERRFAARVADRLLKGRDPRLASPLQAAWGDSIAAFTERVAQLTGRQPPCSDWFVVFGPGWANLGGLSTGMMLVDFFGMGTAAAQNFRYTMPHEVQHLVFGAFHRDDPDGGTVLGSIIGEGFATWFAWLFWKGEQSPAAALGYSENELKRALEHEGQIWARARTELTSRERDVQQRYRAAGTRMWRGGPGKIGYFIGYRIVEAHVAKHGPDSWRQLYDLPLARILEESGYAPAAPGM